MEIPELYEVVPTREAIYAFYDLTKLVSQVKK